MTYTKKVCIYGIGSKLIVFKIVFSIIVFSTCFSKMFRNLRVENVNIKNVYCELENQTK